MSMCNSGTHLPCRMSLVELTFLPLNIGETPIDPDFRQAVRTKKYGAPIKIKGQPNFGTKQKKSFDHLQQSVSLVYNTPGDINETIGYIVFRHKEINKTGYMPKKGDLFVGYDGFIKPEGLELLVEEVRPESPLRGKNLLFIVEVRQNRNKR